MTATDLKSRTVRDLASMAKRKKVPGWHGMKKEELIKALLQQARVESRRHADGRHSSRQPTAAYRKISQHLEDIQAKLAEAKDLTFHALEGGGSPAKDRLVVMVRDPYWLHVYWELSRKSIERAKVALGPYWHGARPVLQLYEVRREGMETSSRVKLRDVVIHGGVNNWYIDVRNPPKSYQLDIGYRSVGDRFFCLARSNVVTTPPTANGETFDKNWADVAKDYDRIFAMSGGYSEPEANGELREVLEERLQRPIGDSMISTLGRAASAVSPTSEFEFEVDTELIVHGVTRPGSHVTLRGEPVKIRSDGTFAVRFNLSDRRHVLPMVASSPDGAEQRTIVLAVDRNTKVMEPVSHETVE
ncbi:MAG: DUF4912 domain-containing protein [Planctomycetaceae bacterium]|nr:DUF4912 domain-containing protein [Planctomycetaceae bacterium]